MRRVKCVFIGWLTLSLLFGCKGSVDENKENSESSTSELSFNERVSLMEMDVMKSYLDALNRSYEDDGSYLGLGSGGLEGVEAVKIARELVKEVRLNANRFPEFDIEDFAQAINTTSIEFTVEPLIVNGEEVNALNFPNEHLIKINVLKWVGDIYTKAEKIALLFHEYLGIMQVKDGNYYISTRILNYMDTSRIEQNKSWVCMGLCSRVFEFNGRPQIAAFENSDLILGFGENRIEAHNNLEYNCKARAKSFVNYQVMERYGANYSSSDYTSQNHSYECKKI